jgi:hypothetical protein
MREKERRNSLRQDSKSMCEVRIGSEVSRGPVINYAEGDGIGLIIKNNQSVSKGALAHITIMDTGVEFNAEVAWIEKLDFDFVRTGLVNITGQTEDHKSQDKAAGETAGDIQESSLKEPPAAKKEKKTSQEETYEAGREYASHDNLTESAAGPTPARTADQTKVLPGGKWPYVLAALLLVMLLAGTLSLLHNKNKRTALPPSKDLAKHVPHTANPPIPEAAAVKMPSFRNAAIAKAMAGGAKRAALLPDFREDALNRFQRN